MKSTAITTAPMITTEEAGRQILAH